MPSSTRENRFGWLGKMPSMREWISPRQVQALAGHDYTIRNRAFELTIGVDRHDIEADDRDALRLLRDIADGRARLPVAGAAADPPPASPVATDAPLPPPPGPGRWRWDADARTHIRVTEET